MTSLLVHGVCPHDCPDTCGVVTEVLHGRAVKFYGDPDHPITRGWLCAKVRPYLDHVYHPDRLLYPLHREGAKGGGQWRRITWEQALKTREDTMPEKLTWDMKIETPPAATPGRTPLV